MREHPDVLISLPLFARRDVRVLFFFVTMRLKVSTGVEKKGKRCIQRHQTTLQDKFVLPLFNEQHNCETVGTVALGWVTTVAGGFIMDNCAAYAIDGAGVTNTTT